MRAAHALNTLRLELAEYMVIGAGMVIRYSSLDDM